MTTPESTPATSRADADRLAGLLAWADDVDTADLKVEDTSDLAAVGAAYEAVQGQLQALDLAVIAARDAGRSWTEIGQRVGMSRQAARQRWNKLVEAGDVKPSKSRVVAFPAPNESRGHRIDDGSRTRRADNHVSPARPRTAVALAPAASTQHHAR